MAPTKRKSIPESYKRQIAASQKWQCRICHELLEAFYHCDHIVPLSLGGSNALNNLQIICLLCHSRKSADEAIARNRKEELYCFTCQGYYSKYFTHEHFHRHDKKH